MVRFWNGITGVGKEDRLRMILGMISGGIWLDSDNETKIGIRIGYRRGAGSKLEGIEKYFRFVDQMRQMRQLRPCDARTTSG